MRKTDEGRGDGKEWRRHQAWELSKLGWGHKEIAQALGVAEGAVSQWMKVGRGACGKRGDAGKSPLVNKRA